MVFLSIKTTELIYPSDYISPSTIIRNNAHAIGTTTATIDPQMLQVAQQVVATVCNGIIFTKQPSLEISINLHEIVATSELSRAGECCVTVNPV